jgi:MFS family permease
MSSYEEQADIDSQIESKKSPLLLARLKSFLKRHGLLIALTGVFVLNALDRQILIILLEDIKQEFTLSDSQLGLLSGFAFVAIYITMSIPAAYLADRKNRSKLIALALAMWSLMTVLCGAAQNYIQLMLARFGVGIGESPCTPAAHSMIADTYAQRHRTTALAFYGAGYFAGSFLGFALGGWIADHYGWRAAFYAVGAPGIILSLLAWRYLKEPARRTPVSSNTLSFMESVTALWKIRAFRWYVTGGSLAIFGYAGLMTWLPTFMIREYGSSKSEIGAILGLIVGGGGISAAIGFGILTDKLASKDRRWNLWIPILIFSASAPATVAAFMVQDMTITLLLCAIPIVVSSGFTAPMISISQQIVSSNLHGMVSAMIFLCNNLIGFGLGPLAVGMVSDYLTPELGEAAALRQALEYLSFLFIVAACMVIVSVKYLPQNADEETHPHTEN